MLVNYIDEIIMFSAGLWASATGFGYLQMPARDPLAREQWQMRFGAVLKWIGPILLVISIALAVMKSMNAGGAI